MRTRISLLIGLIALAIGGALSAWRFREERDARNEEAARTQVHTAAARAEAQRLRQQLTNVEHARLRLQANNTARAAAVEPAAAAAKSDWFDRLNSDPRIQAYFLEYQRSGMSLIYGPLLQRLRLSPADAAAFLDNVVHHLGDQRDLESAQTAKGLGNDDLAIEALRSQLATTYNDAQRKLLGDAGYAAFKTFEQQIQWRMMTEDIAGAAVVAGIPFSRDQIDQLSTTLEDATSRHDGTTDWARVDEQAKRFLTPQQFELIQTTEVLGPMGFGWRFQSRLNDSITHGYDADHTTKPATAP